MAKRGHHIDNKATDKKPLNRSPKQSSHSHKGLNDMTGGDIQTQAAQLGDIGWQTVQRQALSAQIGQQQGNGYLQAVITQMQNRQARSSASGTRSRRMPATRKQRLA